MYHKADQRRDHPVSKILTSFSKSDDEVRLAEENRDGDHCRWDLVFRIQK